MADNTSSLFWIVMEHSTPPLTYRFNGLWSGTTRVGQYQKKHSPTHTHPDHRTSFVNFFYLLPFTSSSLFSLHAWQSFSTASLQVLFGLPLGRGPFTSYSMNFFTQSLSYFCSTHTNHAFIIHTYTHPFKGPFSGTTRVSRYQKG